MKTPIQTAEETMRKFHKLSEKGMPDSELIEHAINAYKSDRPWIAIIEAAIEGKGLEKEECYPGIGPQWMRSSPYGATLFDLLSNTIRIKPEVRFSAETTFTESDIKADLSNKSISVSKSEMVPLGPEDVPPGSAVRHVDWDDPYYEMVMEVCESGVSTMSFLGGGRKITSKTLQNHWLIYTPANPQWRKAEKQEEAK